MLDIQYQAPDNLEPYNNNARVHSARQIEKLMASIKNFGFLVPVLLDKKGGIIAGHGRVEAAKKLGLEEIPTITADALTETQKRAFIIADNKLAEEATWDIGKLKTELEFLTEFEFDLSLTGFETPEIDIIFDHNSKSEEASLPQFPNDYEPETKLGDIWQIGKHKLLCGDSLDSGSYEKLLGNEEIQMVFTDPPYNVAIDGHVKREPKQKAREFAMASGEMSEDEFTEFLKTFLSCVKKHSKDGAILYVCMDWRHMNELQKAASMFFEFKQLCVWAKDQGGMGSFYRSQHELIFVLKNGTASHINNFGLGENGRYRTNVWEYPMVRANDWPEMEGHIHPTVKPTAMVMDAILDCSKHKDIIFDAFGGSGTTLIAAEKTNRAARLIELDPIYCDMIIRRWETLTGKKAKRITKTSEQKRSA
jgi:DNA modification methylase